MINVKFPCLVVVAAATLGCPLGTISGEDLNRTAPYAFGTIFLDSHRMGLVVRQIEAKLGTKRFPASRIAIIGTELTLDAEDPAHKGQAIHVRADVASATILDAGALDDDEEDLFDFSEVPLLDLPKMVDRALVRLDDPNAVVEKVVIDRSQGELLIDFEVNASRRVVFDTGGKIRHAKL